MFRDVKALRQLSHGLCQAEQINISKVFLMFCVILSLLVHTHIHGELHFTFATPVRRVVLSQLQLGVKMEIGSLNSNEPCAFQPHQSLDYLPKTAPSIISLATSTESMEY